MDKHEKLLYVKSLGIMLALCIPAGVIAYLLKWPNYLSVMAGFCIGVGVFTFYTMDRL